MSLSPCIIEQSCLIVHRSRDAHSSVHSPFKMPLPDTVELPAAFDAHVHLRDDDMLQVCEYRTQPNTDGQLMNAKMISDRRSDGSPWRSQPGTPPRIPIVDFNHLLTQPKKGTDHA